MAFEYEIYNYQKNQVMNCQYCQYKLYLDEVENLNQINQLIMICFIYFIYRYNKIIDKNKVKKKIKIKH